MPVSYKTLSIPQRNNTCAGFFKTLHNVSDVQIFAYKLIESEDSEGYQNNIYVVPWDSNIVVHQGQKRTRILDLTKDVELLAIKTVDWHDKIQKTVVFNEKRT